MGINYQLCAFLVLTILSVVSPYLLLSKSSTRTTFLKAANKETVGEARVAPADQIKFNEGSDNEEIRPAMAMKRKEDPAPQVAPQAGQGNKTKFKEPFKINSPAVIKNTKKKTTKKTEENNNSPPAPLDAVASLIKDMEAGQKPGTEATRKILEEEARLKKLKVDEFNYLGTGTVIGGSTLGLILASLIVVQNYGRLGGDVQNITIIETLFAAIFGGVSYAAYFSERAQNLNLPDRLFGSDATLRKLTSAWLGRPTIKNFEGVKNQILSKINGVKNEIETTVEDTRSSIVTLPDTVMAGIEMKVEETKAEAKDKVRRTQERLKAAPKELLEAGKNTASQAVFDLKEAVVRAAEQQVEDLKTLPSRTVEGLKTNAKKTADDFVNDIRNAPGAFVDGIKSEVEAIPVKAQKAVKGQISDLKNKIVGGKKTEN